MRNIFLFLRRYFTFISFIVLQLVALSFLFRYNRFHRGVGMGIANEITGGFNTQFNKIEDYFHLKQENENVHRLNDSLLNLLPMNFIVPDTLQRLVIDSVTYDTVNRVRRYRWIGARVVANSVHFEKNYLQLNKGTKHGIGDNMAVVSSDGSAVGVVVGVSANFSQVRSLLHVQSKTSAMMKRSRNAGILEWDGKSADVLTLRRIPKSDSIVIGDTVVTSFFEELTFPAGIIIGTVEKIGNEKSTGDYILSVKPAAPFRRLQQVFVIENLFRKEQSTLDQETRKKTETSN